VQLTCPCCAARFDIEAALTDDAARQAVAAALKLPAPLGDLVLRYIGLFRPAKRALSWSRVAKLLGELLEPIQAGQVQRKGRAWPAPVMLWRAALEQMLANRDKLDLPLEGHGYLFAVVAGMSDKGEARQEAKRDESRSQRYQERRGEAGPTKVSSIVDPERGAAGVQALREKLGGGGSND